MRRVTSSFITSPAVAASASSLLVSVHSGNNKRTFLSALFGGSKKNGSSDDGLSKKASSAADYDLPASVSTSTTVSPMSAAVSSTSSASAASFPRSVEAAKGAFVGNFPAMGATLDEAHFYNKVPFLGPNATLVEASEFMCQYDVGCVPVLSEDPSSSSENQNEKKKRKIVIGMLSERDLARWICKSAASSPSSSSSSSSSTTTLVKDVMATKVIYCTDETTLEEALKIMDQHNFRHLPVMSSSSSSVGGGDAAATSSNADDDSSIASRDLVGLLSMRDIMHQHVMGKGKIGDVDDFMSWVLKMSM